MTMRAALFFLLFFSAVPCSYADVVYLKNGRSIEGFVKKENDAAIEVDVGIGTVGLRRSEIESIYRSTPEESRALERKWELRKQESKVRQEEEKARQEAMPKKVSVFAEKGQIVVDAVLNRKIHAELVMDTGASTFVLTKATAKKLGVNTDSEPKDRKEKTQLILADGRKIGAKRIVLQSLSVEGVEAENVEAVVLLEDSNEINFGDGLLGMSYLKRFNFQVDFKAGRLILERLR